jgi:hypothetical protein
VDLVRHSASSLRNAAKTFSCTTTSTYDGFHPRHFDGLSDEALSALGVLLDTCEDIGEWPEGINAVVTVLIPKAKGGLRPIGLFSGIYRLWARARRPEAADWDRSHDRAYFSAREGNGALDTVWDQAFRAERDTADGSAAAAVLVDMKSFYEHFDHNLLEERAESTGFFKKLTALALAAYRAPRYITSRGKLTAPLHPKRGVIAGCGFATTWVKVYCVDALDKFQRRHPKVKLDAYIDDLTLSTSAPTEQEVEEILHLAAEDLLHTIRTEL